jgi:hypothetical protein
MMMIIITIIMGHECIWGMIWGDQQDWGGRKERRLRNEEG